MFTLGNKVLRSIFNILIYHTIRYILWVENVENDSQRNKFVFLSFGREKALLWPRKVNLISKTYHGNVLKKMFAENYLKQSIKFLIRIFAEKWVSWPWYCAQKYIEHCLKLLVHDVLGSCSEQAREPAIVNFF